jgi:hypothetical protein
MLSGIRTGIVTDASGKQLGGTEYPRKEFDGELWAKMKTGETR